MGEGGGNRTVVHVWLIPEDWKCAGRTCVSVVVEEHFFSFLVIHCDFFPRYSRSIVFTQLHCPKPPLFHPESFTNGPVRVGNEKINRRKKKYVGEKTQKKNVFSNPESSPMRRDRTGAGSAATLSFD